MQISEKKSLFPTGTGSFFGNVRGQETIPDHAQYISEKDLFFTYKNMKYCRIFPVCHSREESAIRENGKTTRSEIYEGTGLTDRDNALGKYVLRKNPGPVQRTIRTIPKKLIMRSTRSG